MFSSGDKLKLIWLDKAERDPKGHGAGVGKTLLSASSGVSNTLIATSVYGNISHEFMPVLGLPGGMAMTLGALDLF